MSDEGSRRSTTEDRHRRRSHSHHSRERRKAEEREIDGSSPLYYSIFITKHV